MVNCDREVNSMDDEHNKNLLQLVRTLYLIGINSEKGEVVIHTWTMKEILDFMKEQIKESRP